jgi:hypothetical protein
MRALATQDTQLTMHPSRAPYKYRRRWSVALPQGPPACGALNVLMECRYVTQSVIQASAVV